MDVRLHRCKECDEPFTGYFRAQLCSDGCRAIARKKADTRKNQRRAALKRAEWREMRCLICRLPLAAQRSTRLYCSIRCRQKAYRNRVRAGQLDEGKPGLAPGQLASPPPRFSRGTATGSVRGLDS